MAFDLRQTLAEHAPRAHELFADHVNPRLAGVLRTIGFNRHFTRAEGAYLWDERGDRYLDFLGGYAVCNVGRNHPDVKAALRDALEMDLPSMVQFDAPPLAAALARELQRRVGRGLDRAYFTNSGTEGIEAAIKFARCATGRPAVLFAERGFHGLTLGSLSLNGCQSFRQGFAPFLPETRMVRFGDLADLEGALRAGDVAAFVVEPVQGKGVHVAPEGYLEEASRLCHRHGALLVADEVQTGVCRTGRFLAIDHAPACEPDIVVLSKALSGGMVPVGAVLCGRRTWDRVYSSMGRAIVHSSTFHMGALAMAAGLAVNAIAYRLTMRREKPLFAAAFQVPTRRDIDRPLVLGAVLFGIGWGIAGICPGPAFASLGVGAWTGAAPFEPAVLVFLAAMSAGMGLHSATQA